MVDISAIFLALRRSIQAKPSEYDWRARKREKVHKSFLIPLTLSVMARLLTRHEYVVVAVTLTGVRKC